MPDNECRIVLLRSKVEHCDIESIIKDLKLVSHGRFAILRCLTRATLSVYIEITSSRIDFTKAWATLFSATLFTRPVLCAPRILLSSILENDEYQGNKRIYFEKASPSTLEPQPSKERKKVTFSKKLSFRSISKKYIPTPLPPLSPRSFPPPPFYYSGYVDLMDDGNWKVNFSKFFEEVVVPEDDAYSSYMNWVERAFRMRCRIFDFCTSELSNEELFFEVCDHADCHEFSKFPCVGCESLVCKCHELILDNSWNAKIRRAVMIEDLEEFHRCKLNYDLGVRNDPDVLYKDRVQMLKLSNYQTHLAQFTNEQKVERCNAFCQRMFLAPGSSSCTTLSELRKNLWRPLRHSSFFLKKIYNPYTLTKIDF